VLGKRDTSEQLEACERKEMRLLSRREAEETKNESRKKKEESEKKLAAKSDME
jgi:hypothetical protein